MQPPIRDSSVWRNINIQSNYTPFCVALQFALQIGVFFNLIDIYNWNWSHVLKHEHSWEWHGSLKHVRGTTVSLKWGLYMEAPQSDVISNKEIIMQSAEQIFSHWCMWYMSTIMLGAPLPLSWGPNMSLVPRRTHIQRRGMGGDDNNPFEGLIFTNYKTVYTGTSIYKNDKIV